MFIISLKEGRMLVIMNDLNCGVQDVDLKERCSIGMGPMITSPKV